MPTTGASAPSAAFQPTSGTSGSWTWTTSKSPRRSSRRGATDAAGREGREVGDRAVGAEADRAAERDQVVGQLAAAPAAARCSTRLSRSGRIEGSEHADVVAAAEELLGKRLDVPVHAALVGPGIWRDESDAHGSQRVVDDGRFPRTRQLNPPLLAPVTRASAQAKPVKTSR